MESPSHSQLELFSQVGGRGAVRRTPQKPFLTYIRGYEKTMLVIIGIAVASLISFSLGVEKGKRAVLSQRQQAQLFDQAKLNVVTNPPEQAKPVPVSVPVIVQQQEIVKSEPVVPVAQKIQVQGNYTIQVASYKTKESAQKEAATLKKKGLPALVLPKGNYVILCVGNFTNKEKAQAMIAELSKRYKGCYLRRL